MATISFYATGCDYTAYATSHPNGIDCPALNVSNVTGTITIYARDVSCDSGYSLPADVYVNGEYVDYLQSTSVSFSATGVTNVQVIATKTATTTKSSVVIAMGTGISGFSYSYYYDGELNSGSSSSSTRTIAADVGTDITITGFTYSSASYGEPVEFAEYTSSSHTTLVTSWDYPDDPEIRVKTSARYFVFTASVKELTYYGRLKLNGNGGTFGSQTAINWPSVGYQGASGTGSALVSIVLPKSTQTSYIPTRSGYKFLGWATSSTATSVTYESGDTVSFTARSTYYSSPTEVPLYAVWEEISNITLFYWNGSDTADASLIAKGQPVSNITATRWNNLLAKIKELADACGASFNYTTVSSGDGITAARFNAARTGLSNIKTALGASTTLPAAQSSGNTMYATLFNGSTSIKGALNALIGVYNNG
jgi:uncharacterized repeat protein (TIGR02543 family)